MAAKSSPPLAELQRWLSSVIVDREPPAAQVDVIVDAPPLPVQDRLSVYTEAYFLRLLDSLEADFSATRRAIGKEPFKRLAADYLRKHPSTSPNVSDLGQALPHFVRTHPLSQTFPFLSDLIQLEWVVLQTLYTDRLPAMDPAAISSIPTDAWPEARLTLDPTVRLLKLGWPVDKVWEKRRLPEKKGGHRLPKPNERFLLLYRTDAWVELKVIDEPRWYTLQRLKDGAALGVVCKEVAGVFHNRAESLPVMDWFSHWVRAGVIKKIVFPTL